MRNCLRSREEFFYKVGSKRRVFHIHARYLIWVQSFTAHKYVLLRQPCLNMVQKLYLDCRIGGAYRHRE